MSFSIRKQFFDDVLCDAVKVDACHLLSGRPWQFDRKNRVWWEEELIQPDRRWEEVHCTATKTKAKSSIPRFSFLVTKSFMSECLEAGIVYMLLSALELDSMNIPVEIRQLIMEFEDVLPNDLSLMGDIQHCIDLVPGSSLPNKPAYRMNPSEKEEIQKQVGELLTRGYITTPMEFSLEWFGQ